MIQERAMGKDHLFRVSGIRRRASLLTALMISVLAVSTFGQEQSLSTESRLLVPDNYVIGVGDLIDVAVSKYEPLSRSGIRVNEQGTIQLPMFDEDISVACLTERQLADKIKEKYKKYVIDPYVIVSVREFNANPVAVIGAVQSPGRFQIQRPTRLFELMTLVNGPSARAGRDIEIIRIMNRPYCHDGTLIPRSDSEDLITLPLAETLKGSDEANPFVRAGDVIRVVEADEMKAYLGGSVKSSMTIDLKEPVTLMQAVAMAGGLAKGANSEKVLIRRQIPGSINRSELIVNLKAINQGKQDDMLLQANDIVEVPGPSGGKKILNKIVDSILPSLTRLPIGVVPY